MNASCKERQTKIHMSLANGRWHREIKTAFTIVSVNKVVRVRVVFVEIGTPMVEHFIDTHRQG